MENNLSPAPLHPAVGRISYESIIKSAPGAIYLTSDWSAKEKRAAISLIRSGRYSADQVLRLLSFTPSEWSASEKRTMISRLRAIRCTPNTKLTGPAPTEIK